LQEKGLVVLTKAGVKKEQRKESQGQTVKRKHEKKKSVKIQKKNMFQKKTDFKCIFDSRGGEKRTKKEYAMGKKKDQTKLSDRGGGRFPGEGKK